MSKASKETSVTAQSQKATHDWRSLSHRWDLLVFLHLQTPDGTKRSASIQLHPTTGWSASANLHSPGSRRDMVTPAPASPQEPLIFVVKDPARYSSAVLFE